MARPPNPCIQLNGRIVDGVWKSQRGFYIRNRHKQGTDKREFFNSLDQAVARRDHLSGILPVIVSQTRAQAFDDALMHGLDASDLENRPELVDLFYDPKRKLNPEYPETDLALAALMRMPADTFIKRANTSGAEVQQGLTLKDVRTTYLDWYADSRNDVKELKSRAEAFNARQVKREAEPDPKKGGLTAKEKRRKTPRRKRWLDFASKCTKNQYRDVQKFFAELIEVVGNKRLVDLRGDDFHKYVKHVRREAIDGGRAVRSYSGSRFRNINAAFNRTFIQRPDDVDPQRLREYLKILETKASNPNEQGNDTGSHATAHKTGRLSPKESISPDQFKALVRVACTQWKALLMLACNAALKNSGVSVIRWHHLDLESGIMFFPRPKNQRLRQTPLALETLAALKLWHAESKRTQASDQVFRTPEGAPWNTSTDSIGKHFNLLKDETGLEIKATFQALRKSPPTVIHAAKIKEGESAIRALLGHLPNESWRAYVGTYPDYLSDAVGVIPALSENVAASCSQCHDACCEFDDFSRQPPNSLDHQ